MAIVATIVPLYSTAGWQWHILMGVCFNMYFHQIVGEDPQLHCLMQAVQQTQYNMNKNQINASCRGARHGLGMHHSQSFKSGQHG